RNWEAIKAAERAAKGKGDESMLDSVSRSIAAVMESFQMTTKAGRVGFDWPDAGGALEKLDEETAELRAAIAVGGGPELVLAAGGDGLFVAVNVPRLLGVAPEAALKSANRKSRRRSRHVEDALRAQGRKPADADLAEMDSLWDEAKRNEKKV